MMELPKTRNARRRGKAMTRDEKMQIAWIALDGLIARVFFKPETYDSKKFDSAHKEAFALYHKFLKDPDDLLVLLHRQNLAEHELSNDPHWIEDATPLSLCTEIVEAATMDVWKGVKYKLFTSHRRLIQTLEKDSGNSDPS
jgi:hypothetical protein